MYSTSIGGSATGFGADIMVFDDPMNPKMAHSKSERESAVNAFNITFSSRGNNKQARRILIEQRLHKEDITGNVLKQGGWTHLSLPADRGEANRRFVSTFQNRNHPRGRRPCSIPNAKTARSSRN